MLTSTNHSNNLRPWLSSLLLAPLMTASLLAGDKEPVAMAPAASRPDDSGWQFQIKPYGWLSGVDGTLAAGRFSTDVDVDPTEVISHLDWAVFLQAEARRGRWGLLFDGFYAELSGGGTPPNGLYSETNFTQTQAMVELALAYRVLDGQAGYVDVFAGARYLNVEIDLQAAISNSGIRQVSENASARVVESIATRAETAIASRRGEITTAADNKIQSIKDQIIDAIAPKIVHHLRTDNRGIVAEGVIVASGGRFGGYGFYLLKGKPVFLWNMVNMKRLKWEGPDALSPGKHTVVFDFKYSGLGAGTLLFNNMSGLGRPGTGVLKVDGPKLTPEDIKKLEEGMKKVEAGKESLLS